MPDAQPLFKQPIYKTSRFWIRAVPLFFLFLFIISFKDDIGQLLGVLWASMWGAPPEKLYTTAFYDSLSVFGYNSLSFLLLFFVTAIIVSGQALLPTHNLYEAWNTFFHLLLHLFRMHGLAIFVKDGKVLATPEDWKRLGLGVIVIDFNSAVVLEEQVPPPSILAPFYQALELLLRLFWLYPPRQSPRACQAGISFTRKRERIRGVVDLRKQSRARLGVCGYTRDGIEMKSLVFTVFTLGQAADVLPVAYLGQRKAENMRAIYWKRRPDGKIAIVAMNDELDGDDRSEIQLFAQRADASPEMMVFNEVSEDIKKEWLKQTPLKLTPTFNEQRVFNAIFTQARSSETLLSWDEMPVNVTVNLFRNILLQHNFDEIFHPDNAPRFPLKALKDELRIKVRNNGILSYQLVLHRQGKPLTPGLYDPAELLVSRPRPLTASKPLRDRGIKMLVGGFNDLLPVSEQVYHQRLENWRAKWASQTEEATAVRELEASRIMTQARKQGIEAMTSQLKRIFEIENSDEAMAVAVLQALESAVSDPRTRQLLPSDTLSLLRMINNRLVSDQPTNDLKDFR
ncbi:MAG: hypothetical protein LWX83_09135 [Anaerolineae bacterium]|nr:hypothetical protein [Anaerolineae bacterium]